MKRGKAAATETGETGETGSAGPEEAGDGARPRRRSDPWKVAFVTLMIVALLAVVTWVLLGSRLLVVRDVEVSGVTRLDPDTVVAAVDVPTGTPLARVDTDAATRRAEKLRLVEAAEVTRGWPATLRVSVTERTPRLSIRVAGGYRLVDHDGVRIADADKRPADYPLTSIKGEVEGNPGIAAAAEIVAALPKESRGRVAAVEAEKADEVTLTLDDGAVVEWGGSERNAQKGRVLRVLMREHPSGPDRGYDVSAPDVAVVR